MRLLPAGLIALAVTAFAVQPVYAKPSKRSHHKSWGHSHHKSKRHHKRHHWQSSSDAHTAAIANDLDPSGTYSGYPDWARIALSPKFDGRD